MKSKAKTIFISGIFAYIYIMIALLTPTNLEVIAPGEINNVSNDLYLLEANNDHNLYTVSVYTKSKISIFSRILYRLNDQFELRELSEKEQTLSKHEQRVQGNLSKDFGVNSAVINAFKQYNKTFSDKTINVTFEGLNVVFIDKERRNILPVGSLISKVNNKSDLNEMLTELRNLDNFLEMVVDDKIVKINRSEIITISVLPNYSIEFVDCDIDLKALKANYGGSSGSMMQTINLYLSLINESRSKMEIVGTGVVNLDGTIGQIGGVVQKVITAKNNKINHFLVASNNYDEISSMKTSNFNIYSIETIEEALVIIDEIYS